MMVRVLRDPTHWLAAAVGILLAVVVGSQLGSLDDVLWRWYDSINPPATIQAKRVLAPANEMRAELTVTRHREECQFIGPSAFEIAPDGSAVRIYAARADDRPFVQVPSGIRYIAAWRFWPVGIGKLRVWMDYLCDSRPVRVEVKGL